MAGLAAKGVLCDTMRMRRITCAIILAAFVFSCGGNWAVLQGIAWANMIREYSEVVPLAQAVQMTLSGEYPCVMCKAIAEKKSSEQQKSLTLKSTKEISASDLRGRGQPESFRFPVWRGSNAFVCPR